MNQCTPYEIEDVTATVAAKLAGADAVPGVIPKVSVHVALPKTPRYGFICPVLFMVIGTVLPFTRAYIKVVEPE